jgi:outer membrane biosynthesis protein TonB
MNKVFLFCILFLAVNPYPGNAENIDVKSKVKVNHLDDYKVAVMRKIQTNWSYPDPIGKDENLETLMAIKISSSGEIIDQWFLKKSEDKFFDEYIEKAVLRSDPLPPFPKELKGPYIIIGLRFTPKSGYK